MPTEAEAAADAAAQAEADKLAEEKAYEDARKDMMAQMREEYLAGTIGAGESIDDRVVIEKTETPEKTADGYVYTKYTTDDDSIVHVTYENGTQFILNYNNYAITTILDGETYTVDSYGYVVIK